MKVSHKQLSAVLELSGQQRLEYFVKVVADWQEVWGLYLDGWALAATDDGVPVFPLWPAKEYAQVCAEGEWKGYEPRSISLDDLMRVLLPKLRSDAVLPGVFPTPTSRGVTPSVEEFMLALEAQLEQY